MIPDMIDFTFSFFDSNPILFISPFDFFRRILYMAAAFMDDGV